MDGIISDPAHRIKICILCAGFFVVKKDLLSLGMGLVMIFSLWFLMRYFLYTGENPAVDAKAAGVCFAARSSFFGSNFFNFCL